MQPVGFQLRSWGDLYPLAGCMFCSAGKHGCRIVSAHDGCTYTSGWSLMSVHAPSSCVGERSVRADAITGYSSSRHRRAERKCSSGQVRGSRTQPLESSGSSYFGYSGDVGRDGVGWRVWQRTKHTFGGMLRQLNDSSARRYAVIINCNCFLCVLASPCRCLALALIATMPSVLLVVP